MRKREFKTISHTVRAVQFDPLERDWPWDDISSHATEDCYVHTYDGIEQSIEPGDWIVHIFIYKSFEKFVMTDRLFRVLFSEKREHGGTIIGAHKETNQGS